MFSAAQLKGVLFDFVVEQSQAAATAGEGAGGGGVAAGDNGIRDNQGGAEIINALVTSFNADCRPPQRKQGVGLRDQFSSWINLLCPAGANGPK